MRSKLLACFILVIATHLCFAQQSGSTSIQPTIMVIPFTPQGKSLRTAYEQNELVRVAITKVKEGFDARGVNTIDLRGKLKQVANNEVIQEDQASDMKDEVIQLSGADIYVEVEANQNRSSSGNSVTVIMTAYDAFSGESYANKVATSPKFYTDNYEKLVTVVVEDEIENFLNTINDKFTDLIEHGRTVVLNIGFLDGSVHDMDMDAGDAGQLFSEVVEDWVHDNAYKNYFHLQGTTSNKMIFDIVKVPLKDEDGRNYRISRFAADFRKFLTEMGLESDRVINGANINITIQ